MEVGLRRWRLVAASVVFLVGAHASAQELWLNEIPYQDAMDLKPVIETFESHAGLRFTGAFVFKGGQVGQVLRGQTLKRRTGRGGDEHWVLDNRTSETPLSLDSLSGGEVGAVIWDGAFGTQALAGIGPIQSTVGRQRLGTGILTILFDEPQCLFALRTWLDGEQDNIVMRSYPEGNLNLIFWNREGNRIGEIKRFIDHGLVELAYIQSSGGGAEIHAVTIQNLDPQGIGIDEVLFSPLCPMMVSALSRAKPKAS